MARPPGSRPRLVFCLLLLGGGGRSTEEEADADEDEADDRRWPPPPNENGDMEKMERREEEAPDRQLALLGFRWGVGGAVVVADVVLDLLESQRRRREKCFSKRRLD